MSLLGIDIGTTGTKAIVFTDGGIQIGYGFEEYGINHPQEGYCEQDGELIWSIAKKVIKKAVSGYGDDISAISLSVQGDAILAIDDNRNAITPVQLGMDYRGVEEVSICNLKFGEKNFFNITGIRSHPLNSIIKILWIKRHMPEVYERAYKFVTYSDYILGKLGSEDIVIDYTQASRTMAFDLKKKQWSDDILDSLEISKDKLAKPVPSCTIVGEISKKLADELGINQHAKLVSGGHDQTCASLGAGIVREGMALDSHGTAEVLSTVFSRVRLNDEMYSSYYPCYCSLINGLMFSFALNHTGGILLKWFAEEFCGDDNNSEECQKKGIYQYLFDNMKEEPSNLLVLPYFNGSGTPTCDLTQKGAILGLRLTTNRFDVAKAIIESLSFETRLNIDAMEKAGIEIQQLRSVGGGARNPIGLQNKADILGIPVSSLKTREAACLGAAFAAGIAIQVYSSAEEATSVVQIEKTYYPNESKLAYYNDKYEIYKTLYPTIKDISSKL